ncbi:MAG: hypothetical protein IPM54_21180 [Polyangiaceae bacterium]|nr:hypothetical protein [Polyangiaceae bacterium]
MALWCWGSNSHGQPVYDGWDNPYRLTNHAWQQCRPRRAGQRLQLKDQTDGTLWCWGAQDHGALGNGNDQFSGCCQTTPVQIGENTLRKRRGAGGFGDGHACALKVDGTWCWGEAT